MQVDVGQERRDPRALRGPRPPSLMYTVFQDPRPQPLPYQAEDARVADPVVEDTEEPFLVTARTTASVDAPFHNPTDRDSIEIEVTDSRHPLFGRRLPLVSVSARRSDGHALVAYRDRMLLKLPVVATSLAPRQPQEA